MVFTRIEGAKPSCMIRQNPMTQEEARSAQLLEAQDKAAQLFHAVGRAAWSAPASSPIQPRRRPRIRICQGKSCIPNTTIPNPFASMKKDRQPYCRFAHGCDSHGFLCLPLIFSVDEIEDCRLQGKVLDAQKNLADDLKSGLLSLQPYGFEIDELRSMAESKIRSHAEATRRVLFANESSESRLTSRPCLPTVAVGK